MIQWGLPGGLASDEALLLPSPAGLAVARGLSRLDRPVRAAASAVRCCRLTPDLGRPAASAPGH